MRSFNLPVDEFGKTLRKRRGDVPGWIFLCLGLCLPGVVVVVPSDKKDDRTRPSLLAVHLYRAQARNESTYLASIAAPAAPPAPLFREWNEIGCDCLTNTRINELDW